MKLFLFRENVKDFRHLKAKIFGPRNSLIIKKGVQNVPVNLSQSANIKFIS
jgi:hypothetical protein